MFTDKDALNLLRLLSAYAREYAPDIPQTLASLVEDLSQSLDEPSVEAEQLAADLLSTDGLT